MTTDEAAWEEVLIAHAAIADLDDFIQKYQAILEKRPLNRFAHDLLGYALYRKGATKALMTELLETYSIWQNRPLVLTRVADILKRSGDTAAAAVLSSLAAS